MTLITSTALFSDTLLTSDLRPLSPLCLRVKWLVLDKTKCKSAGFFCFVLSLCFCADSIFWPHFSRKQSKQQQKQSQNNILHVKTSPYVKN